MPKYLRETSKDLNFMGLDTVLSILYPNKEWMHDCIIPNLPKKIRPDYRCEELKMIVEYDGILHYTNPDRIDKDIENQQIYESYGYKVIRIPYFVQLTSDVCLTLFNIDKSFMSNDVVSLDIGNTGLPKYLCFSGLCRMYREYQKFPQQ